MSLAESAVEIVIGGCGNIISVEGYRKRLSLFGISKCICARSLCRHIAVSAVNVCLACFVQLIGFYVQVAYFALRARYECGRKHELVTLFKINAHAVNALRFGLFELRTVVIHIVPCRYLFTFDPIMGNRLYRSFHFTVISKGNSVGVAEFSGIAEIICGMCGKSKRIVAVFLTNYVLHLCRL